MEIHSDSTQRDRLVARAYLTVNAAIKRGLLPEIETQPCMDCGALAECWDHRNYYRPLAVDPVCKGCNNRRGPGFPYPSEEDRKFSKSGLPVSVGAKWSVLDGDSRGSAPKLLTLRAHINWRDLEEANDTAASAVFNHDWSFELTLNKKRGPLVGRSIKGPTGVGRYEYFKAHDPWTLR